MWCRFTGSTGTREGSGSGATSSPARLSRLCCAQGPFGAREAAHVGIELCGAIGAVHAAGLLHRDIKAGNVMREEGGRILLVDFGLTQEGEGKSVAGTPPYMGPELLAGGFATVASDIYALGVLLFHLTKAKYPVEASTLSDYHQAHLSGSRRRLMDAGRSAAVGRKVFRRRQRTSESGRSGFGAVPWMGQSGFIRAVEPGRREVKIKRAVSQGADGSVAIAAGDSATFQFSAAAPGVYSILVQWPNLSCPLVTDQPGAGTIYSGRDEGGPQT
jgi:serine/threonine protein kinase